jgi:undecaprenyl-diphosphatase
LLLEGSAAGEVAIPDLWVTLLLAVVQGLSEFLPISSDGHLVICEQALGVGEAGLLVTVALHLGTLTSVLWVYRREVADLLAELGRGRLGPLGLLALGTLPAAVVGVAFRDFFHGQFQSGRSAALGLLVTSAVLFASDRARRKHRASGASDRPLDWRAALCIGCAQALAIMPGISRSGSTIGTGLMLGVAPVEAARFSFLLSIPAILGAAVLELGSFLGTRPAGADLGVLGLGLAVSALVGLFALRALLAFLNRGAFVWFGVYCALVGLGYLALA